MTVEPAYLTTDVHGTELTEDEREWCDGHVVRTEPFRKTNWKTAASRDRWDELTTRIEEAHRMAEWRSVLSDETDREAAIIHVNNYNRERWLKRVGEHGLEYRDIRYSEPYEGFSHKHYETSIHDPERFTYAVIAKDEDVADKFYEAETEFDNPRKHRVVGEFLGFPKCCREFFVDVWHEQGQIDPVYEAACNSACAEPIDDDREDVLIDADEPWNNMLWRYIGLFYQTHIPCSFDCEGSAAIAKARGRIMAEHGYRNAANALWEWLREPAVWTGHNGLAHVKNRHLIASAGTSDYWSKKRVVWKRENDDGGQIVGNDHGA